MEGDGQVHTNTSTSNANSKSSGAKEQACSGSRFEILKQENDMVVEDGSSGERLTKLKPKVVVDV